MKVLYCRVGYMNSYNGGLNDSIINGGAYNKTNTGHEIYNYRKHNNNYYGYVQAKNGTINISKLLDKSSNKNLTCCTNVLVVWLARNKTHKGQRIIGWYNNATVYKKLQQLPEEALMNREDKLKHEYNIVSSNVTLLNPKDRTKTISGIGQSNVWYGNDKTNLEVISYIQEYAKNEEYTISRIDSNLEALVGIEKDAIIKTRVNQDYFRKLILEKYDYKCCLCGLDHNKLLIASHIKPWSKSDKNEKLNQNNGLLLCANHDKLFDSGLISFDDNGNIIICSSLTLSNRNLCNLSEDMKIEVNEDNIHFIRYHRKYIFIK